MRTGSRDLTTTMLDVTSHGDGLHFACAFELDHRVRVVFELVTPWS